MSSPIEPNTLYRIEDLKSRTGIGDWGFRQMRRAGLPVRYVGGRGFCLGQHFIDHVIGQGDTAHCNAR